MNIFKNNDEITMVPKQTLAFDEDDTVKTFTMNVRGLLHTIVMKVANFTNVVTATLTIANSNSDDIYDSTAKAKNATYVLNELLDKVPLVGDHTVTVTLSGAAGGTGGDVEVTLYVK